MPKQNHRYYADIFKLISMKENCCVPIQISIEFICKFSIMNMPKLVPIMASHESNKEPFSELMMV